MSKNVCGVSEKCEAHVTQDYSNPNPKRQKINPPPFEPKHILAPHFLVQGAFRTNLEENAVNATYLNM